MDLRLMTSRQALREHDERVQKAARSRQAVEAYQRMRIRSRLRKAILETIRLDGSTRELAIELAGLVQTTERQLTGGNCCQAKLR